MANAKLCLTIGLIQRRINKDAFFLYQKHHEKVASKESPGKMARTPKVPYLDPFKLIPCHSFSQEKPVSPKESPDCNLMRNQKIQTVLCCNELLFYQLGNFNSNVIFFQGPFYVEIHNTALIIMDIHAHVSKTEVIGMLGGCFHGDEQHLEITMAIPCNSISTGLQCEMDPGWFNYYMKDCKFQPFSRLIFPS